MPGNLLVDQGRLSAVIDWGSLDVGDPAYDLMPAWNLLPPGPRRVFLDDTGADAAAVRRGRGWALAQAIGCLGYHRVTNPRCRASRSGRCGPCWSPSRPGPACAPP